MLLAGLVALCGAARGVAPTAAGAGAAAPEGRASPTSTSRPCCPGPAGRRRPRPPRRESTADSIPASLRQWIDDTLGAGASARVDGLLGEIADATQQHLPDPLRDALAALPGAATDVSLQAFAVCVLLAVLLVLVAVRVLVGRGDLAVNLEYPSELRGTFSVRLAKQPRPGPGPGEAGRADQELRGRPPGRARGRVRQPHRALHGLAGDPVPEPPRAAHVRDDRRLPPVRDGDEVLATHPEVQEMRLRRRRTVRVVVRPAPGELPDRREGPLGPPAGRRSARRDPRQPGSLRYARGGPVRIDAGRGSTPWSWAAPTASPSTTSRSTPSSPRALTVDLTGRENMLFTGCPPAVEPYLHGDVAGAARALEREGQNEVGEPAAGAAPPRAGPERRWRPGTSSGRTEPGSGGDPPGAVELRDVRRAVRNGRRNRPGGGDVPICRRSRSRRRRLRARQPLRQRRGVLPRGR